MPETIRTILQELYELEPELKAQEAELAPLVLKLIQAKPDIKPSPEFVATLKLKLANQEQQLMSSNPESNQLSVWFKIASFMRQPFILTGAAVIVFVLILVSYMPGIVSRFRKTSTFTPSITRLPANSFGSLLATADSTQSASGLGGVESKLAAPVAAQPDQGTISNQPTVTSPAPAGLGGGASNRAMIYPYPYPAYTYKYTGEPITDLPAQVDVLRRVKNTGFPLSSSFFKSFDIGDLKLNSFSEANLSQITLTEDKDFGYIISIDFTEGTVSINENWRRWPQALNNCSDEVCYKSLQLKPENVPADEALIKMSNDWLVEHGINPTNYGEPFVQNDWRLYYAQAEDKTTAYVPEVAQVMYPIKLNNDSVYENGGNVLGLGVNINVRYSHVSGLWNLMSQQYQSSAYESETDFDTLVKYATSSNQGYPMPLAYPEADTKASQPVEFSLGTPSRGYLRYWNYNNGDNQELMLPALIFPVETKTEGYAFMPRSIVVPLVKEFLQSPDSGGGPIRIMPMGVPGATGSGGASAGSAGTIEPSVVEPPKPLIAPSQ